MISVPVDLLDDSSTPRETLVPPWMPEHRHIPPDDAKPKDVTDSYMLGELQRGRAKVVAALHTISGESLVQGMGLTTEEVMERWLAWGEAKGYIPIIA
ncbi:MAG: hypothetical protein KTV45_13030 [Acidimicrobiia bacterium]|nr:hypothetical protein [Acidimicrobiia bacterium]